VISGLNRAARRPDYVEAQCGEERKFSSLENLPDSDRSCATCSPAAQARTPFVRLGAYSDLNSCSEVFSR